MIFAARKLQEKCREQHRHLFTAFIDLTNAFDTIYREGHWKIMAKYGIPETFIAIVKSFHEGMLARVLDEGESSEKPSKSQMALNNGRVLASTRFSMFFLPC